MGTITRPTAAQQPARLQDMSGSATQPSMPPAAWVHEDGGAGDGRRGEEREGVQVNYTRTREGMQLFFGVFQTHTRVQQII